MDQLKIQTTSYKTMTKRITQLASVAMLSLAATSASFADIKLNDNISLGGYVVGSTNYIQYKPTTGKTWSTSKLDGDAYKFWSTVNFAPVSGTISYYAGADSSPVVLDAYATYDVGGGTKISFGKFLSWLGYEAFDPINMTQLTYGWATPQGFGVANIPAYHSGVKVETGNDAFSTGIAILDSVDGPTYYKGDGDLKNGPGVEAYFTYKGVKNLTIFLGGYLENNTGTDDKKTSLDLWAQYVLGDTTFAAEASTRKDSRTPVASTDTPTATSNFWLAEVQQTLNKVWAVTARISGVSYKTSAFVGTNPTPPPATVAVASSKSSATTFTLAPACTLTANLSLVAEYSYTKYKDYTLKSGNYVALQARFKF